MERDSTQEPERVLVSRSLAGEAGAFDRLCTHLDPMLRSFIKGQIHSRPDVDVEDVLQDVRIYLHRRLDRYRPEYPVAVFARGLARNIVKRHLFRKNDLTTGPTADDEDGFDAELSPLELSGLPLNLRAALGEGRFESPDGPPPVSREFLEVLEIFLRAGGYPHQQIAFGFSILVWGKAKREEGGEPGSLVKVPVTGDPDRVVTELGPGPLAGSSSLLKDDLEESLHLDSEFLARVWRPLETRLVMTGERLFARDATSRRAFAALAASLIGETLLQQYFGRSAPKSVADWTRAVKERIRKALLDPGSLVRSPIPGACENFSGNDVQGT